MYEISMLRTLECSQLFSTFGIKTMVKYKTYELGAKVIKWVILPTKSKQLLPPIIVLYYINEAI